MKLSFLSLVREAISTHVGSPLGSSNTFRKIPIRIAALLVVGLILLPAATAQALKQGDVVRAHNAEPGSASIISLDPETGIETVISCWGYRQNKLQFRQHRY